MTGWRVGFAHGPSEIMATMLKIQQYSFVCAPQPAQWGALRALEVNVDGYMEDYRHKRDRMIDGLSDVYEITKPGGAFYMFPKAPIDSGAAFVLKGDRAGRVDHSRQHFQ